MLNLEDFMNIRDLKQQGWSVSAIADELNLDRKQTVLGAFLAIAEMSR